MGFLVAHAPPYTREKSTCPLDASSLSINAAWAAIIAEWSARQICVALYATWALLELAPAPRPGHYAPVEDDVFASELWVIAHDGERGVLHGNPHTFPGRFSVLWESTGETHATSLSDLAEMSAQSRVWLAGFLSGNEPEPSEVLGLDDDAELTDEQYAIWRQRLAEFREAGAIRLPIRGDDEL